MSQDRASREIAKRDELRIEQAQWLTIWRDTSAFCCPQKQQAVNNAYAQINQEIRPRFNPVRQSSTAVDSLNVFSGGCKTWLVPGGDEGFGAVYEPDPARDDSAPVKDWLAECTQRLQAPAERGGFFTAAHEMLQDLGWAGTSGMLIDDGMDDTLMFCQAMTVTNFLIERDGEDNVIRVIITWSRSATLIADMFNRLGDKVPDLVRADIESNRGNQRHELIQSIHKRTVEERDAPKDYEPNGQPFASCWIHVASKTLMRERGYPDMPFIAPRWNTWAGTTTSAYGTSPAMQALADMRGLNLFDMIMSTRAEIEINPRVKVLPSQSGTIDLSPGGITQMAEKDGVTEWGVAGMYPVGKDQSVTLAGRIKRAFFTDLWEAATPIAQQREMNIPVLEAVQREAAGRISPAMGRVKQDFFDAAMTRMFMMAYRAGVFSPAPPDAFQESASGRLWLILPRVTMANRMSRTLNARKSFAFSQAWSRAQLLIQANPAIMDLYKVDEIARDLDRGDGMPPSWHRTPDEVKKLQEDRLKATETQMAQNVVAGAIQKDPVGMAKLAGIGPQQAA